MSIYGINEVQLDNSGRISKVKIQQIDAETNSWIGEQQELNANDAASRIISGDKLYALFSAGGKTVLGPKFRKVTYSGGHEGIEFEVDSKGRSISELPKF